MNDIEVKELSPYGLFKISVGEAQIILTLEGVENLKETLEKIVATFQKKEEIKC